MQSVVVYGRFLARAIANGFSTEIQRSRESTLVSPRTKLKPFQLVTAASGISKGNQTREDSKKLSFGDDAYFIAKHQSADVIGNDNVYFENNIHMSS